jgi:glycosyltransferase involved in cell wall biosynthesis
MRIALLAHAPVRGGSTDLFIQARDFFRERGHTVQPIFGQGDPTPDPRTGDAWVLPPSSGDWRAHLGDYLEKVNGFQPDLIYAIGGRDEADLMRFLSHVRVRHISSLEQHEFFNVPFTLKRTRRFLEACTANTPDTLEQVKRITDRPVFLLPYLFPEPLHQITEIDSAQLLDSQSPIEIAFVGRLECFQKRCDWLPEIIRRCDERGARLAWHFYGDGPYAATLRQRLAGHASVSFHGWVSRQDLYEKLPRHDIFFLCSRWEGLPIAMVEAMRCGLACVVPDIPAGMRWALERGGGWLYHARSPRDAAETLLRATRDRELLHEKRAEALQLSGELFSVDRAREQFLNLERSFETLHFNGDCLKLDRARKFRAVSVPTYLRRLLLRPQRT